MEKIISEQRRKDLEAATKLYLDGYRGQNFEVSNEFIEYAGFYHLTNEAFENFFEIVNISKKTKALSVLASGDQVFELVLKGISDIDTFDINRLTEYYALGFKKRAIECLGFEDYKKLFEYHKDFATFTHYCEHLDIENFIMENMEVEYKWFWKELLYNLKQDGFNASVFHFAIDTDPLSKFCVTLNSFMKDKEKYKKLQKKLLDAKITFNQTSIVNVPTNFKKKYDLIYLSNVMDYDNEFFEGKKDKSLTLLKILYDNKLNNNGEILFIELLGNLSQILDVYFKENIIFNKSDAYVLKKER